MAVKISEMEIDGAPVQVYDLDAIHKDELISFLEQASIREAIGNLFFPVGSIYTTSSDTDPSTLFGGEWERVEGRVIMGADANHLVNTMGGSEDAVVPAHSHQLVNVRSDAAGLHEHTVTGSTSSNGEHRHSMDDLWSANAGNATAYTMTSNRQRFARYTVAAGTHTHSITNGRAASNGKHSHTISGSTESTGVDGTGKNNMPYVAYYIWRRTA